MTKNLETVTLTHYPELDGELTQRQWDVIDQRYHTPVLADKAEAGQIHNSEWVDTRFVSRPFGERSVRIFVDRPTDSDDKKLMVALGEFGNGLTDPAIHRARIVRDAVTPEATLILLPNDTYDELDNLGFTPKERAQLRDQEATPFIERLQALSEGYEDVSVFGPSQGATVGAAFGADRNSPSIALGAIEAPNVVRRPNRVALGKDFAGSAGHLIDNIRLNAPDEDSLIIEEHVHSINLIGNVRYGLGIMLPSNLAIASLMKTNNFKYDAQRTLENGGSVSHVWTANSRVSRDTANTTITDHLVRYPNYSALRLAGEIADHSSTNVAAVCVAAMNRAVRARSL